MKSLPIALTMLVAISSVAVSKHAVAQQVMINGKSYTEVTDIGPPRVTQRAAAYTAHLPSVPTSVNRTTAFAGPADRAPSLYGGPPAYTLQSSTNPSGTYPQVYRYGYGYTSQGSNTILPVGYSNTVPLQQTVPIQSTAIVQPLSVPYNPYVQTRGVPWKPIVAIRSLPENVVVGQGIIGQPKAYVPSQPVRNFIRYITP